MSLTTILIIVLVALVGWLVLMYNGLVRLKVRTNEAWSDIDVQMKRRYDLIPNLLETVKAYASHEKTVLENVTRARTAAMSNNGSPAQQAATENMLSGALKSLFAVSENYPDLKANQNFQELQRELVDTEDKIQASRRFYNGNVRDLNTKIEQFPSNIVAKLFAFKMREFFELEESEADAARKPVQVKF